MTSVHLSTPAPASSLPPLKLTPLGLPIFPRAHGGEEPAKWDRCVRKGPRSPAADNRERTTEPPRAGEAVRGAACDGGGTQADGAVEGGQLRERGFYLFHDVPLTGVNIDHVVRSSCWQRELAASWFACSRATERSSYRPRPLRCRVPLFGAASRRSCG